MKNLSTGVKNLFLFYYNGFINMSTWGRKLWLILLIKLFIIFAVLRIFFFHDFLHGKFTNDKERSKYVLEQLTNQTNTND